VNASRAKIPVLYLHAQSDFKADSTIHAHLVRHLDRSKFVVHVACTRGDGESIPDSLKEFQRIPDVHLRPTAFVPGFRERSIETIAKTLRASLDFPLEFAALAHYIRREGIRIIHSTDRPRDALYAVTLARLTGIKSVVHVHVKWSAGYSAPARWAVRNCDAAFSISKFVTDSIVAQGKPRGDVYTILNSVEADLWDPSVRGDAVRREFSIPEGVPLLASVSRLFAEKGTPELLQAFAVVRKEVPAARLLIVGDETPFSQGFAAEMKTLAAKLGVSDAVVFTGPRSDVAQIMAACDVFTMPSYEEPFGLVYLEAMAMKRPVISVDNGGTPEVVEHGLSGLLSPHKDVSTLAANIVKLLADPELRARMGDYGRKRVLESFDTKRMAEDAARAYQAILSR